MCFWLVRLSTYLLVASKLLLALVECHSECDVRAVGLPLFRGAPLTMTPQGFPTLTTLIPSPAQLPTSMKTGMNTSDVVMTVLGFGAP